MAKKGNGEGSIYEHKRNGKRVGYRGAYTVHTAEGPKRRYVSGKTREEARQKLTRAMADRDGGLIFDAGSLTVGEYLERWLKDSVRGTVRQSTYERYEHVVHSHTRPTLGRIKLKSLTPAHVRGFYRGKLDAGLAPATVHKMHVGLHKALDQAVADGLIPRNVTDALKIPRTDREEINPLTAEEANRLLEAASGDRLEALYVLAIHTGLRQGELLALKWEDVDLERSVLRVYAAPSPAREACSSPASQRPERAAAASSSPPPPSRPFATIFPAS
jgi:integrase